MTKLRAIQTFRALAASGVVLSHAVDRVSRTYGIEDSLFFRSEHLVLLGHAGVDLFFIISGFIMVYVHGEDFGRPQAARRFFVKRLTRIVPIYWILTSAAVAILLFYPGLFYYARELDWPWVISSYVFLPWRAESGLEVPLLGVGWTLNYEMYFYVIFAAMLAFPRRFFLPAITVFFVACVVLGLFLSDSTPALQMLTSGLLLEFLMGCYIGSAMRGGLVLARPTCVALAVIGASLFAASVLVIHRFEYSHVSRLFFWGLPLALLVASSVLGSSTRLERVPDWVVGIGDSSYSLYLTHVFTLPAVAMAMKMAGATPPADLTVLALLGCAVAAGWAFFRLVERPIGILLRPRARPAPAQEQVALSPVRLPSATTPSRQP